MAERVFDIRKQTGFTTIAFACFAMLYMPIILLVVYSFNAGTSIAIWEGFSWRWYASAWENEQVQEATLRSLVVALWASGISTTVAVLAALATTRTRRFRGQTAVFALINQPLMVPEIVTAVALLIFFAMIKVATGYTGLAYLILAHSAFCIPFAYLPIRARLQGMDLSLEQAAADLYATPFQVFRRVTLPQLWPGILAGAMLAFVISLDDVVITEFVKSAGQDTLPTYMLGQLRRVVTPEINAISTALLGISITMVIAYTLLSKFRK
ncbi:ABC transporter permease [Ruegeria pomeroyi]|uniref:Spermidine/putrescine transport system permease protein PotC n=2 Tax=Ruegeria TaxID=97050 RepID=A0A9Q3WID2_9RHOB|nr:MULTISPECIES: ABC transporter permease [Ruegeria]MCE8518760.1 ABC transporter permease [Ruegeria pomeroyi]MCE8536546.1 ABC transporter permease [Ruegeria pomeroyi]MCE8546610.1 ABC transporter permease [Ruegeria pomeroyi]MCG6560528.1 ABC transporter permease [Ruegeria alba]